MRYSIVIAISAFFASAVQTAIATEPAKRVATIDFAGVELRAGPSMSSTPLGVLQRGDSVIVLRDDDSFYAIQPPKGYISWVKAIHLSRVIANESGRGNATVAVPFAPVMAGSEKADKPSVHKTVNLPEGAIVEVLGQSVKVDETHWYPVSPPEGDLRYIPKNASRTALSALPSSSPYVRNDPFPSTPTSSSPSSSGSATPVSSNIDTRGVPATPVAANLPRALADHRLWPQASAAERNQQWSEAEKLYATIYEDLWNAKAERDALVICYNRAIRCQEMRKGITPRREPAIPVRNDKPTETSSNGNWSQTGTIREMAKVFIDGQQAFALDDERGNPLLYVIASAGVDCRAFAGKRVRLFGVQQKRDELYRPFLAVEKIEAAR
jgi:hypothetical protein